MILRRFFAFLLLLSFCLTTAFAQEDVLRPKGKPGSDGDDGGSYRKSNKIPIMLGLELGMNYNMFSQNLSWYPPAPNTPYAAFESGEGMSGFFGLLADVSISKNSGIQLKISYDRVYYENALDGTYECWPDFGTDYFDALAEWNYNVTGTYIDLALLYRYNITENLVVMVGPFWRNPVGDYTLEKTITMKTVDTYITYNNDRYSQLTLKDTNTPDPQFGIDFGVGYKILLSKNLWLVPQARIQYSLTPLTNDYTLSGIFGDYSHFFSNNGPSDVSFSDPMLHSLKLSAALWFEL